MVAIRRTPPRSPAYLASDAVKDIYASYGFVPASAEELTFKPIPK